MAVATRPDPVF